MIRGYLGRTGIGRDIKGKMKSYGAMTQQELPKEFEMP
jgi:hypothetical protein